MRMSLVLALALVGCQGAGDTADTALQAQVDSLQAQVDALSTALQQAQAAQSTHDDAISALQTQVDELASEVANSDSGVDVLALSEQVAQLQSTLSADEAALGTHGSQITANTTAIATNISDISTNTTAIGQNASAIASNRTSISANATGVSNNTAQIAANTTAIGTNETDIATNASGVSTNASAIATNAGKIDTNGSDIAVNTSQIATNTSGIAKNAGDIAANLKSTGMPDCSRPGPQQPRQPAGELSRHPGRRPERAERLVPDRAVEHGGPVADRAVQRVVRHDHGWRRVDGHRLADLRRRPGQRVERSAHRLHRLRLPIHAVPRGLRQLRRW